jgi:membrane protein
LRKAQRVSFPGFDRVPIYDVGRFFWMESRRDRLTVRASAMAFSFVLATFPGLLFLFTVIPFIPVEGLEQTTMGMLEDLMPADAIGFIRRTVRDIFAEQRFDLLSVGIVLSFFFSTNGVNAMIASFNKQHPNYTRRSFWKLRLVSIRLTFFILLLFIGSLVSIIGGRAALDLLEQQGWMTDRVALRLLGVFRWAIILVLYFGVVSLIYYEAPARKKKWTFVTPGSTLATVLGIATTLGFGYVAGRFGRYNELYGSLGALIVFMVWMNLNTFVLLVGFELNNAIDIGRFQGKARGVLESGS